VVLNLRLKYNSRKKIRVNRRKEKAIQYRRKKKVEKGDWSFG
jgi:hypothetical protein